MRARGLAMDRFAINVDAIRQHPGFSPVAVSYDNAINAVGTHTPDAATGHSLILNGHIDVVPTGPLDMWSVPPYEPALANDWLHGRGAGDMKAALAANLFALDALHETGFQPAATLYMHSVPEEECTGNGALACLVRGYRADCALNTEPMNDTLVRAIKATVLAAAREDSYLSNHPPVVSYNGFTAQGYVLPEDTPAEQCLRTAPSSVFGADLAAGVCPAYLDARVFALYDNTPALVYGPICERLHGFDERVHLESVRKVTKTVALFICQWCGIEILESSR
jgi:acetylornithine deacetylase/succinyl-diaminopimelate desuccinylase-like protein